jgi:hypothetical protein
LKAAKHSPQLKKPKKQKHTQLQQIWPHVAAYYSPDPTITRPVCKHFYISLCLFWLFMGTLNHHTIHWMSIITQLLMNLNPELIFGFTLVANSVGNRTCI